MRAALQSRLHHAIARNNRPLKSLPTPLGFGAGRMMQMRIVLRKQAEALYLQPSGEFNGDRESAWDFETSSVAWSWAKERKLPGLEVVLAFEDAQYDVVSMRT